MRKLIWAAFAVCLICSSPVYAQDNPPEEEHQPDETSDCLASWDPFCPRSTPGSDDDVYDYPSWCFKCEWIDNEHRCRQVAEGTTGRDGCKVTYWETTAISCTLEGSFCENITVKP
jgi:hypothetical protein